MSEAAPSASPIDAAQDAIEHARRLLFPFRFERWLALGFLAFLDQCGRGGGGGGNLPSGIPSGPEGGRGGGSGMDEGIAWIAAHVPLVVAIAAGALLLIVALAALLLWLNSRGIFMYMDAVATGRPQVGRAWREHAERASSLFAWRFGAAMAVLVIAMLMVAAAGLLLLMARNRALEAGAALAIGLLGLLPLFLLVVVASVLFEVLLRDFVAPLQWLHGWTGSQAIPVALRLARRHLGSFLLYLALKIVFAFAFAITAVLAGCLTCCLGFLPVVSQTLLQPILFFERAWSLFFLRRLGHDVFAPAAEPADSPSL